MVSDTERRALFDALVASIGPDHAATMMELLPPVGWGDVARQADITALRGELKGEMGELRGEMRGLLPRLLAANIASMIGVAGLVLAAARFT